MTRILTFIARYMEFLWVGARFKITESEVSTSNGGDAFLMIESEHLRLRFVCDRTQLLLDVQPSNSPPSKEWFSVDLIRRMLLGRREESAILDESYARFIEAHLDEIENRFTGKNFDVTRIQLRELKVKRSRELFG